ncbi:unnamed protein product [Sphenostylis stenocarpa]|uniref:2-oxoglutarate-dependent dioxygenase DAO n=1 Tax=Sphenostylis stenocarpa TaxID=92480 RepID=A0AA86W072_9FABA|nr:unnamed protein product [Sphenostylis stenocarpa]CAJ1972131.1 unnamed protein product [Sphenostylis stenocarpa]
MGCESLMIPCLKLSGLEEGSEEWREMSKKVRDGCESHGCFVMVYDNKVPKGLREDMFACIKELFDLPEETKRKETSKKPYRGYNCGCPVIPLSQSFGIDDAPLPQTALAFTNLMWPQGNPHFCETLNSTSSKLLDLSLVIMKMLVEAYGLPKEYTSDIEELKSSSNFRLMKYKVPESGEVCETALLPHTDKSALTILCENQVEGLEVLSKSQEWVPVKIPEEGFVVIMGDVLKAWSNGRVHAATHRVMMKEEKERYSFALFAVPKEEVKIEVPPELVEEKIHPLRYRAFNYGDYFAYFVSTLHDNALDLFAGLA